MGKKNLKNKTRAPAFQRKPLVEALALAISLAVASSAQAAINVNSTSVTVANDGNCTLPEAIMAANTGLPVDECLPEPGSLPDTISMFDPARGPERWPYSWPGPTINFAAGYNGTSSALPAVTSPITIEGNGSTLRGDYSYPAPGSFRAFEVTAAGNLVLDYLRLQNFGLDSGNGGAILTAGPLTLRDSLVSQVLNWSGDGGVVHATNAPVVVENSLVRGYAESPGSRGGAVYLNGGSLTADYSYFNGRSGFAGGGIFGWGADMAIDHSTIRSSRTDQRGGGIYLQNANLSITNSVVSSNRAFRSSYAEGVGILPDCTGTSNCIGGGIFLQNGTGVIANSTVGNNQSFQGGSAVHLGPDASLDLIHATVTENTSYSTVGAALYGEANGPATLFNSIVGSNRFYDLYSEVAVPGMDCLRSPGGVPPTGFYNLVEINGNCALSNGVDGNLVGIAPLLGPPQNNTGGPWTVYSETHAPLHGSPVIDTARTAECTAAPIFSTDQTNQPRPEQPGGTACDMGAMEVQPLPNLRVEHIKTPPGDVVLLGGSFDWTVRVTNVGTTAADFADTSRVVRSGIGNNWFSASGLVTPTGLSCNFVVSFLECTASGPYSIPPGGSVDVSFVATAHTYALGLGIVATADPDNLVVEYNENDNTDELRLIPREQPTSDPATQPDYIVDLNNYPGNELLPGDPFRWGFRIRANTYISPPTASVFLDGSPVLRADLPAGIIYDPPVIRGMWEVTGLLNCGINGQQLTCLADGDLILESDGGISVNLTGTLGPHGVYRVPDNGGECAVDPDNVVQESDDGNNNCSVTLYSGRLQSPTLCGSDNVVVPADTIYPPDGSPWVCTANQTLGTNDPVILFNGSALYYQAPQITFGPGFSVEAGGELHAGDSLALPP